MRYTTADLAPLWREVYSTVPTGKPHVHGSFMTRPMLDGSTFVVVEHADVRRSRCAVGFAAPEGEVRAVDGSTVVVRPWTVVSERIGAASLWPVAPGTRFKTRPGAHRDRHVPAASPTVDALDVASALAHVSTHGRGADTRLTATEAVVVPTHVEGRVARLAEPLPVAGESVFGGRSAEVATWAGAVRVFAAAEGAVTCRVADVGLPGVRVLRLRVDAPSGAWAVLDLSEDADPAGTVRVADVAGDVLPRVAATVTLDAAPRALVNGDRLVLDVRDDVALVSAPGGRVRPRRLDARYVDGRASTCVDPAVFRDALARLDGPCRVLVSERPTDPVLVASLDGRRVTAVLPCVTSDAYPYNRAA